MAADACSSHRAAGNSSSTKPHKEHLRKSKDSRRRQAALLFLNNISLDGRPTYNLSNGNAAQRKTTFNGLDAGAPVVGQLLPSTSSYGTFPRLTTSVSGGAATPAPRTGIGSAPPVLVLPTGSSFTAIGVSEGFLEGVKADPLASQASVLSPAAAPQHVPLLSTCKSPTLLSVQSCNSVNVESRQRSRNQSGSPGPRGVNKVHFIKNMRQYDTRGSRIMLICAKRSLCAAFSILPYGESFYLSDPKLDTQKQRHSSGGGTATLDMIPGLEGVELGAYGKTVSYARFLFPTNALVKQKNVPVEMSVGATPMTRSNIQRNYTASRLISTIGPDTGVDDLPDYDPNLLSDPQWPCGKHKRVLIFASYMTTVIEYVKPSDLKKGMNETFREKFPYIKLTLSKIRSLKREMRAASEDCGLQPVTVAMAYVYFEKLVLQGRLNKQNRKLVAAACVVLAAKISSDLRRQEVKQLIDKLEERFRISRRELIPLEFTVLVALEMALYLPESKVMPHYRRLAQQS
ncbi:hypothetical protein SKAU_G00174580 [Synaphobranchus kaupii]|uniref:Cyclin N-terminal domain-containing protein n=1 Tax=Synaphobranchus kaupii TaxID=118154 RepID=A0A9Q1J0Q1_SYNKA|nr:hypothetical protein SKAU_G00174580 [Synaphobranchus kaupii]